MPSKKALEELRQTSIAAQAAARPVVRKPPKKKGGPTRPPKSRRGPDYQQRLDEDAAIWTAENFIQPFELPRRKPPPKPKTFAEDMARRRTPTAAEREALRKKRVAWAQASIVDPKARRKLADTMTPARQADIIRRSTEQRGPELDPDDLHKLAVQTKLEQQLAKTKDPKKKKALKFVLDAMDDQRFGEGALGGLRDIAGAIESGIHWTGRQVLSEDDRRDLAEYFAEVNADVERWSEEATEGISKGAAFVEKTLQPSGRAGRMGVPLPTGGETGKEIARASVKSGVQSIIGLGPGLAYMAGNPAQALSEYERYIRSYYGPLSRGDITPLREQGVTPGVMDILGLAAGGAGVVGRARALGRTAAFRGPLRVSSEGRAISTPEALARAAVFRQEPVDLPALEHTTMGRPVRTARHERYQPVREGDTIQVGDQVEYRVGDTVKTTTATRENELAGLEAPDVNNPIPRKVNGEDAEVISVYRQGEFEQRMLPRSPVGQFLSNVYWWLKPSTGRERGLATGKGSRKRAARQMAEVEEDRERGRIKAFMKEHRKVQKDVVLSTAYDRAMRYGDEAALADVNSEIEARRRRGLDVTREERQVLATLEKARDELADPSRELTAAIAAGRLMSRDTEEFLIRRGFLTREGAEKAKMAAKRWLEEGHLEDDPLTGPVREQVEQELGDHFYGNEDATRMAMAYTDTLARAWGKENRRDPADWYAENISGVESVLPERIEELTRREQGLLAQTRDVKRVPLRGDVFPYRDPETGDMRVARMAEVGWEGEALGREIDLAERELARAQERVAQPGRQAVLGEGGVVTDVEPSPAYMESLIEILGAAERRVTALRGRKADVDTATLEWVQGPDAGKRFTVPLSSVMGNTSRIHGWYSGVSNVIEQLPERVSKQEAISRITKAPGVKKDELEWMGVDAALERLFQPGVKSVSRDELKRAINGSALRFETVKLSRDEAYYENQYDVTLPGPRWDYHETLLYYPERHIPWDEYEYQQRVGDEAEYLIEAEQEYVNDLVAAGDMTEEEALLHMNDYEPYVEDLQQEPALYEAPHFGESAYSGEDYSGNLLAHLRQSGRWLGGAPIRVIEETQSDWHQAGRRGYRTPETEEAARKARRTAEDARQHRQTKKVLYDGAFRSAVEKGDVHVRGIINGLEGNVEKGTWGEMPYYRVHVGDDEFKSAAVDLEPTSDQALRDMFEEYREADAAYTDADYEARQAERANRGPANAPWKGEKWEELLFREAVRQAVADGETRIAWTTGAQQANRYNELLAANVNRIEYDGETLRVRSTDGGRQEYSVSDQDTLVDYVGTAMASRLTKELAEKEIRHDVFPVDRGEYGATRVTAAADELQPGDQVWVGVPTDREPYGRNVLQFSVRERPNGELRVIDQGRTIVERTTAERDGFDFPFPFREEGMTIKEFGEAATEYQRRQYEEFGETRREPAVLEGEGISIGGGGFIDAYDRRMRSYAKKYLGNEPRRIPLDDLTYDTIYASDPQHPEHPADVIAGIPVYGTEAEMVKYRQEVLDPALNVIVPIHRVRAGDKVLAESESLQAALQAAFGGGPDAGRWPSRVRRQPDGQWAIESVGGRAGDPKPTWSTPGDQRWWSAEEARQALDSRYDSDWIDTFDRGGRITEESRGAGEVWVVDIPEKFAAQLHEKGSPLFQRRRGSVLGLTRLTDEGADVYLDRDAADIATWVEEATHAAMDGWFDDADARGDPRADLVREKFGIEAGGQLTNEAREEATRFLQSMLMDGFIPAPQQRSLMRSLSAEMREAYEGGWQRNVAKNKAETEKFKKLLADPDVTSFFRDVFDVAPMKEMDPGPIFFQTMKTKSRLSRAGRAGGLPRAVRSLLPSRGNLAGKRNEMIAWESGSFDVGPDMTAHYANAELRTRMQDEQAKLVLRYQEPIEVVDNVPVLKDGFQVYNYFGIRRADARIAQMYERSQRYGDIETSENEMLSPDPTTGSIVDMEPEDFMDLADDEVTGMLRDEMLYDSIEEAQAVMGEDFLRLVREGKVGQIPNDVAEAFLAKSGAGYSLAAADTAVRAVMTFIRIPSMLARWRMVGKAAYPIVNAGATFALTLVNQGPMLPFNFYRQYATKSRATRIRLLQEVGVGIAELTDVSPLVGKNRLERWQAAEQEAFRRTMHALALPESHIRLTQMENDLGRAGYRTDVDVQRLLDLQKQGDVAATKLLNQIGRTAEDAVVRFRGLEPVEQTIVRDMIFVYGWLRAAARFTLRFPLERPVTAAVAYHIGQYGWEKLQEQFYALAWEQQGAIPIGKRRDGEETLRKLLDLSQLFPFKSGVDLMRPVFQILGVQDTGLRPANFGDLLSPSADFAIRAVYGQDPRFATGFWEGLKYDADPRNLPGVFWISRLIDPSLTGTKLRADRDRWSVVMNFFGGMAAPYEVKQSVSYERWLEQQPAEVRTLIREQNDANQFALLGEAAYKVEGGALSQEQLRAINADSAYSIYSGLLQSKKRREKNDSSYYLSALERSASRAKVLEEYYPDAYAQAANEASGLDPRGNDADAEAYIEIMDDAWEANVSDTKSEVRTAIKDNLGFEAPESSKIPFKRWARNVRWLQTAPPASITRIQRAMERQGVTADNTLALAPIIEDEMRRAAVP